MEHDTIYLAAHVTGVPYEDEQGPDYRRVEEALAEDFGITVENFDKLAARLLQHTISVAGPLTGKPVKMFGITNAEGIFEAIVKVQAEI